MQEGLEDGEERMMDMVHHYHQITENHLISGDERLLYCCFCCLEIVFSFCSYQQLHKQECHRLQKVSEAL